jgi:TLC domain
MNSLAELVRPTAYRLNLSTLPLHAHHVAAAYVLYETLFRVVSPALSPRLFPRTYARLSERDRVDWHAHVVSMAQCLLINSLALAIAFGDPDWAAAGRDWRSRLWAYSPAVGRLQGFVAGYFVWDAAASAAHLDVLGVGSLVHAVSALGITLLGFRPFANYYGVPFILYEVSTPFLNMHWFLERAGRSGGTLALANGVALVVSFAACRLVWGGYMSMRIYADLWAAWRARGALAAGCAGFFSKTRLLALVDTPLACRVLPSWLAASYVAANSTLTVLNFYWFGQMMTVAWERLGPKSKPVEKKD